MAATKLRCPNCDRENAALDSHRPDGSIKCLNCGKAGTREEFQPAADALVDGLEEEIANTIQMGKDNPHHTARAVIKRIRAAMNSAQ